MSAVTSTTAPKGDAAPRPDDEPVTPSPEQGAATKPRRDDRATWRDVAAPVRDTVSWILLITALLAIGSISFIPKVLGHEPLTVLSGSMSPTIEAGDVIWVDTSDTSPGIGDIVTFHPKAHDPTMITHRVIAVNSGTERVYITQGDANGSADEPIVQAQIIGTVAKPLEVATFGLIDGNAQAIPKLGYAQEHLPAAGAVLLVAAGGLYLLAHVASRNHNPKKD